MKKIGERVFYIRENSIHRGRILSIITNERIVATEVITDKLYRVGFRLGDVTLKHGDIYPNLRDLLDTLRDNIHESTV